MVTYGFGRTRNSEGERRRRMNPHRYLMIYVTIVILGMFAGCGNEEEAEEPPVLELSKTSLDFGKDSDAAQFRVINLGGGEMHWRIEDIPDWLAFEPAMGETTSETEVSAVIVNRKGLRSGRHEAQLKVISDESTIILEVSIWVDGPKPGGWFGITNQEKLLYFTVSDNSKIESLLIEMRVGFYEHRILTAFGDEGIDIVENRFVHGASKYTFEGEFVPSQGEFAFRESALGSWSGRVKVDEDRRGFPIEQYAYISWTAIWEAE